MVAMLAVAGLFFLRIGLSLRILRAVGALIEPSQGVENHVCKISVRTLIPTAPKAQGTIAVLQ